MVENFPEIFEGSANIDARSTTKIRCILSMGAALQQMKAMNPHLRIRMDASKHDMWYLNHQDTGVAEESDDSCRPTGVWCLY